MLVRTILLVKLIQSRRLLNLEIIVFFFYNIIMKILINKQEFNVDVANTFIKRFLGLMGKKNIKKGIFFPKTKSIHTFFMRESIDIIMINRDNKIVYYKANMPKNKIIIKKEAYHTIELPNNSLKNIKLGDQISIT